MLLVIQIVGGTANEQVVELRLMTQRVGPCRGSAEGEHAFTVYRHAPLVRLGAVYEVHLVSG
jgi:hypothetical protein